MPLSNIQIITIAAFVFIFFFETFFPYRKQYTHRFRHFSRNAALGISNIIFTGLFGVFFLANVFLWVEKNSYGLLNQINLSAEIRTLMAIIILDAWMYTWHRLNHTIPFLWRFHQVHHNDPMLDLSTSLRFHPIEVVLSSIIHAVLIMIVGIRIEHMVIYKLFFHICVYIHHSNVFLAEPIDRFIRLFVVTPNMHRVHHSSVRTETDSNFSSLLSIWDRMFKSYQERDPDSINYGLDANMEERWQTAKGLFSLPFINRCKTNKEEIYDQSH